MRPLPLLVVVTLLVCAPGVKAKQITLVATNDTHSYGAPHGPGNRFGGYARIATIIDGIRAATPNVLVLDGGDWVEGTFLFRLNAPAAVDPLQWPGTADLYLKNLMGYDVTVLGNHDLIDYNHTYGNGNPPPDTVFQRIQRAGTLNYPILAYNFDPAILPAYDALFVNKGDVMPYSLFDINGVTVAVGGVSTDLFVYQMYFTDGALFTPTATEVQALVDLMNASGPDLTLLLNHVGLADDADIARTTHGVDAIVGGHSHHFLSAVQTEMNNGTPPEPVRIIQGGSRGMFVSRLDLDIDDATKAVTVLSYQLVPVDGNVSEKPAIASVVQSLAAAAVAKNGPVFGDSVATMAVDVSQVAHESSIGNAIVDAMLAKTSGAPYNADLAWISNGAVSNPGNKGASEVQVLALDGFRKGNVTSDDVYRVFGHGYNPVADRNYRIFTVDLKGSELRWLQEVFNFGDSVAQLNAALFISMAGGDISYDPTLPDMGRVVTFDIGGSPVVDTQAYTVAVDEGALQVMDYLVDSGLMPFNYTNKQATGIEVWTALKDYLAGSSPVGASAVDVEGRYRTMQQDLCVQNYDISISPPTYNVGDTITVDVTVRNFGETASGAATIEIYADKTPFDWTEDPNYDTSTRLGTAAVPAMGAFPASTTVSIPLDTTGLRPGKAPLYVKLAGLSEQDNTNHFAWVYTDGFVVPWRLVAGRGPGASQAPEVRVYEGLGTPELRASFAAYGGGSYGANVAAGDVDGTATDEEILTGAGPGAVYGPQIRGFRLNASAIAKINFYAYGTLRFGVHGAGGDIDGDGYAEILTGAGPGAVFGPHVRGFNFDGGSLLAIAKVSYFAYGTLKYGVNVASGDLDADAPAEILTGPGPGAVFGAVVRGFNYDGLALTSIAKINFTAIGGVGYGARVGDGDTDADGNGEILASPGPGPALASQVRGYNYDGQTVTSIAAINLIAFPTWRYGAKPTAGDVDADGYAEILASPGPDPSAEARARGFNVDPATPLPPRELDILLFDPSSYGSNVAFAALAP